MKSSKERESSKKRKISTNLTKILVRTVLYSFVLFLLLLIPAGYFGFFVTTRTKGDVMLFLNYHYFFGQLIFLTGLVLWMEYYFFRLKGLEIENKLLRIKLTIGIIFSFFLTSNLFIVWLSS